jgi:hypothetical protein
MATVIQLLNSCPQMRARGLTVVGTDGYAMLPFHSGLLLCPICGRGLHIYETVRCYLAQPRGCDNTTRLFVHEECVLKLKTKGQIAGRTFQRLRKLY